MWLERCWGKWGLEERLRVCYAFDALGKCLCILCPLDHKKHAL